MTVYGFPVTNRARALRLRWVKFGLLCLPVLFATSAQAQAPAAPQNGSAPAPPASTADTKLYSQIDAGGSLRDDAAPGELRGMWVVCYSLRSPASVHQVVETARKYHLNALFVQVRSRADAWYRSRYEPRAEGLAHQPPDFDPLAQIVAEGHAAGLQIHAWLNTYLTWSSSRRPYSSEHLWNAHPDWFAHDRHGRLSTANTEDCEGVFLQPSNPAVQQHLFDVFTDVAARYDVDGIHFDYVRYPNSGYDFSSATLARFRAAMRSQLTDEQTAGAEQRLPSDAHAYVHAFPTDWETWRRAQVTDLVARIAAAVKADKPWMQVSAAVFANADDAKWDRAQDWIQWLKTGVLDSVALMAYGTDTQHVLAQTRRAVAVAGERKVYIGIGAWRLSAHDVAHKIAVIRQAGASGVNLFSYDGVHERSHYLDTLARGVFASRSAPPRMRWLPSRGAFHRNGSDPAARSGSDPTATTATPASAASVTTAPMPPAPPPHSGARH